MESNTPVSSFSSLMASKASSLTTSGQLERANIFLQRSRDMIRSGRFLNAAQVTAFQQTYTTFLNRVNTFDASHNSLQKLPAARKLASDAENFLKEIEETMVS
jgi:hypothetical protein